MKKYIVEVYEDRTEWKNEDGKFHREDGPAIEWNNEYKAWWFKGKLHREDGPAIEHKDGSKFWWVDGNRHRLDGPAIERCDGSKEWWIEGKELSEYEFNKRIKQLTCEGKVIEVDGVKYKLTKV